MRIFPALGDISSRDRKQAVHQGYLISTGDHMWNSHCHTWVFFICQWRHCPYLPWLCCNLLMLCLWKIRRSTCPNICQLDFRLAFRCWYCFHHFCHIGRALDLNYKGVDAASGIVTGRHPAPCRYISSFCFMLHKSILHSCVQDNEPWPCLSDREYWHNGLGCSQEMMPPLFLHWDLARLLPLLL